MNKKENFSESRREAPKQRSHIIEHLEAVDQQAAALYNTVHQADPESSTLLPYLTALSSALEELKISEEELCQQNEELRSTRQALEAERYRYQELFELAPDSYFVTDHQGTILEVNRAATELLNLDRKYIVGKPLVTFVAEEQRRVFRSLLLQLRTIDRIQEWELPFVARNGKRFEAALTVATVKGAEGNTIGLRWLLRDITARKQIEDQLRQIQLQNIELLEADRLKEQFIATMSHELRTPLTAILGFSGLLLRQFHQHFGSHQTHLVERIFENGRHLLNLIEDILDYSSLRANQLELNLEPFDLVELVNSTVAELQSLAERKQLDLRVQLPQSSITVVNDRVRVRQILVNLISNAIKFTEAGSISVELRSKKSGRVLIAVQDTGIGIDEADLRSIFQEFRQANQTTTRHYPGTGLGLAITKALVKLMGGQITVESRLGLGSTFVVELPCRVSLP